MSRASLPLKLDGLLIGPLIGDGLLIEEIMVFIHTHYTVWLSPVEGLGFPRVERLEGVRIEAVYVECCAVKVDTWLVKHHGLLLGGLTRIVAKLLERPCKLVAVVKVYKALGIGGYSRIFSHVWTHRD